MKTLQLLLSVFLLLACGNIACTQPTAVSNITWEEFQKQSEKWRDAYNSKDARNLLPFYTEDARYVSAHVPGLEAIGRESVIANFQKGMSSGGHIDSIKVISMHESCEMVTILTMYQATNSGETVTGRNLLVLKKVNGSWLIIIHITVV